MPFIFKTLKESFLRFKRKKKSQSQILLKMADVMSIYRIGCRSFQDRLHHIQTWIVHLYVPINL